MKIPVTVTGRTTVSLGVKVTVWEAVGVTVLVSGRPTEAVSVGVGGLTVYPRVAVLVGILLGVTDCVALSEHERECVPFTLGVPDGEPVRMQVMLGVRVWVQKGLLV